MTIITLERACPICGSAVKGSDRHKFYCRKCNILFERPQLATIESGKENTSLRPTTGPESVSKLKEEELPQKYVVSSHSNKYHRWGCRYITQIKRENLYYFNKRKDAEQNGYTACICRRQK